MIENKESSFIVKGFFVRTVFFPQNNLFYAISANWYILTKIQLQNPAIIAYSDFYCSLSIVIVMTLISICSTNLKDSLMISICGKFELPNYKSKVEIRTSSFSAVIGSSKSRQTTFSNFNEDSPTHL